MLGLLGLPASATGGRLPFFQRRLVVLLRLFRVPLRKFILKIGDVSFMVSRHGRVLLELLGGDPGFHPGAAPGAFDHADRDFKLGAQLACEKVGRGRKVGIICAYTDQ